MKPVLPRLILATLLSTLPAFAQEKGLSEPPTYPQPAQAPAAPDAVTLPLEPEKGETIVLIGNTLGERMQYFGAFETALHARFADRELTLRNLCNPGDTAGLRPNPGRTNPWAFPAAEKFHPETQAHFGEGHYPNPDEWLTEVGADTIIAFFGYNESFDGVDKVQNFRDELRAFIDHTQSLSYNGKSAPRIVLVTPIAFEDRTDKYDLPDGTEENARLEVYSTAILDVAGEKNVGAVDLFTPTLQWFQQSDEPLTLNGCHLSEVGYERLAPYLLSAIFGEGGAREGVDKKLLHAAVTEKNWFWQNDYRMLNGVHVWGRRWKPYGNVNYPEEIEKIRQMTRLRDAQIWEAAQGRKSALAVDDSQTRKLTPVETNFNKPIDYLAEEEALKQFTLPEGYQINLFASEKEFPLLENPVQMGFDNKGRLWVSVIKSYPHYLPGGDMPDDKLLIFEDTDQDGRADKQTVFAEGLSLPIGFELAPEGVYVSEEPNMILLEDTDGDDQADRKTILLGGFDSHDTHHAISAYTGDPSGAFYMCEGRFLHSQVETPYGPQRMTDGGVWRFHPHSWRLERFSQVDYNNPWGLAFDEWGQTFMSDASGGENVWLLPLSVKVPHGMEIEKEGQFTTHRVRPTSGTEFIYSRHFPDEVQGDFLVNNTIGFLGTKQHTVVEDGAGYTGELRQDLVQSSDPNFRPVDLEFAPDGSLYLVDYHNALIGHMQHSARDPNRDSEHGRIYRVTHKDRPLLDPPLVAGAPLETLLENLKLHEYRARYRTQRELRGRDAAEVLPAVKAWAAALDKADPNYERNLLEALWVTWGQHQVDMDLLKQCLTAGKHQTRSAATRVLRHTFQDVPEATELFLQAIRDEHPRVRLEAIAAASWMDNADGARIVLEAMKMPIEKWMGHATDAAMWTLRDDAEAAVEKELLTLKDNPTAADYLAGKIKQFGPQEKVELPPIMNLSKAELALYKIGEEVYKRDAHCITCHQADGKGLPNIYPGLIRNEWVLGDEERLIKITLKGLWGPIEVNGQKFDPTKGVPPMTGFAGLLSDEEIAGVLTYVRNHFGNRVPAIHPEMVARIRKETEDRQNFYMVDEILKEHPLPGKKGFVED